MIKYKAVKETTRNYYKRISWSQPTLSANGTLGGNSFAVAASTEYSISGTTYYAYRAFDKNDSTDWITGTYSNNDLPIHIIFYNPEPLNVLSLSITNRGTYNTYPTKGNIYGSNDNVAYKLLKSFNNSTSGIKSTWTIDLSDNTGSFKYYKLEIVSGVWATSKQNGMGLNEISISAATVTSGTSSDYDFYEDVNQYKAVKETVRKYYKYVDEVWANPIMTAQIDPGGDKFAAFMDSTYSTRYAYHMFDNQTGTGYTAQTQGTLPHHLGFYNPDPVRITNLTFNWVVASSVYYSPRNGQLEASNDGTNWVTLQTFSYPSANPATISFTNPSNNYYKYYRLYGTDGGKSTAYACTECTVSGYSRTGIIETTEQDYDFYEDVNQYKAILD